MIKRCPIEMFTHWVKIDIFYKGLSEMTKRSLDHSAVRKGAQEVETAKAKSASKKVKCPGGGRMEVERPEMGAIDINSKDICPKHPDNPFSVTLDTHPASPKAPEYRPKLPYPQKL
ncbi:hypothetical protein AHAS_Ahas16G0241900 [Arachis hypogaea]